MLVDEDGVAVGVHQHETGRPLGVSAVVSPLISSPAFAIWSRRLRISVKSSSVSFSADHPGLNVRMFPSRGPSSLQSVALSTSQTAYPSMKRIARPPGTFGPKSVDLGGIVKPWSAIWSTDSTASGKGKNHAL